MRDRWNNEAAESSFGGLAIYSNLAREYAQACADDHTAGSALCLSNTVHRTTGSACRQERPYQPEKPMALLIILPHSVISLITCSVLTLDLMPVTATEAMIDPS